VIGERRTHAVPKQDHSATPSDTGGFGSQLVNGRGQFDQG